MGDVGIYRNGFKEEMFPISFLMCSVRSHKIGYEIAICL